jgi:starch phosphorylase
MLAHGVRFWDALWITRAGNVFTTHTPVAAAFDTFPIELLAQYGRDYAAELQIPPGSLLGLGRAPGDPDDAPFNMAYLAARTCIHINGVSRLHGEVSRRIFQPLYPRVPEREVPVDHITNGVHMPSWDSATADALWTGACGKARWRGDTDGLPRALQSLGDEALWQLRGSERAELVRYARSRLAMQLGQRGADARAIEQAADLLDPNALTLGFARRFTEYKRPHLLLSDPDRLARLLASRDRPVQIIVAGKAHPHDAVGKEFVRQWATFVQRADVRAKAVFLEDYDMALAQELVQGVDVWINTPRRPWEACGTSGMKVLVNGGLNLSSLDGWWAEAHAPALGWAIGGAQDTDDASDALALYEVLEREVVPDFYDRDAEGLPRRWIARLRASVAELAPRFSSNRMLREYVQQVYLDAAQRYRARCTPEAASDLKRWSHDVHHHWQEVRIGRVDARRDGDTWDFRAHVYLGSLSPDDVAVQLYAEPQAPDEPCARAMQRDAPIEGAQNGFAYRARVPGARPAADFTPRVVPQHPLTRWPIEQPFVRWPAD